MVGAVADISFPPCLWHLYESPTLLQCNGFGLLTSPKPTRQMADIAEGRVIKQKDDSVAGNFIDPHSLREFVFTFHH